ANVLHATRDIRQSLRQARRLLAHGGLLFLLECTQRQRLLDIIFGLTEGWWQFTDTDLRPDYPLLCAERWLQVLAQEGFEAAALPAAAADQSVLIARRGEARERGSAGAHSGVPALPRSTPNSNGTSGHQVLVIFATNADRAQDLLERLDE